MANQREIHELENQVDKFSETLATARKMQQDWLNYGLNFIHLYVEDVDGDWLETWEDGEIIGNSLLDSIKEFLVSDDRVALRVRQHLKERSLFDLAVNLEEYWRIYKADERLSAVRNLLASNVSREVDDDFLDLADSLLAKLAEVL
ncbi:hypothetical protein I8752_03270 [Nostocaceae cyanobacterium CENA369]|uniref:Uncharacterized protein n=1 Tax=Dendronalium phyllosphericum CENA369 TaxID=1725256 RepID=A0A8J7I418_9NOST|nr:hypothetical protein [Dendronalium phyllosphericum]MBH8572067.1 hypothetical protein [Dendronalium phyllosphericum CENA369]